MISLSATEAHTRATFSIPAYLVAMLVASEVVAILMLIGISFGSPMLPGIVIVAMLVAPVVGLFASPLFLPAALITLYLANRWKIEKPVAYGSLGGVLSGITCLIFVLPGFRPNSDGLTLAQIAPLFALVAGFSGGFTYRCVARQDMRNILT
ncbi:MAG: hypothetical protein KIT02_13715 [Devosia sp.]|uniref:hypothetical protein n=1 Tax=Devosia sp. TaxID=1871048 RepID=UPI0024CAF7E2|nr:hypothetical protein [Devosia sp.]UYN98977.1 MAG: hypothetical protein KIT02_13715 [Devosia sp.]